MKNTYSKILDILPLKERKQAYLLMGMLFIMALLDILGIGSILPFIALLAKPTLIETNPLLKQVFQTSIEFGVETEQQFLFVLGIFVFAMLILSVGFKMLTTYAQTRFILFLEFTIGKRLIEGYLYQPYSWFLSRNSADLCKVILSEVSALINNGILPFITLVTQSTITFMLMILLLIVDPFLAITVCVVLGLIYGVIFRVIRDWLERLGHERAKANHERFIAISEALGAIKELKFGGFEKEYIQRFAEPSKAYYKGQVSVQVIAQLPRFLLEAVAFGGMLLVMLYLIASSGSFADAVPTIALYAFAGYRLMPALQQIYAAFAQLRFAGPTLNSLHDELMNLNFPEPDNTSLQIHASPMILTQAIALNQIFYSYPSAAVPVLKGINLYIPAKSIVGFVGSTGSGKTTVADIVLGLLEAQSGSISVDGEVINATNHRQWRHIIGYVPQQIYLADDSIIANIALGFNAKDVNLQAIEEAAKIANLHDFIMNDLPQGYNTNVGERGVRLSGGQRQRIGIARALYRKPQVLIFDEATSALDNLTEHAVMESVKKFAHGITIILIAHRLNTVRHCDSIYLFERGEVKASGSYEELIASNNVFAEMVGNI